jgi:NAD-dependent dihydropyrimidine dehydrogenase PreA subunit
MKITILLHSATGNTRLITRYAAGVLERLGHSATIHEITKHPEPPPLDEVDLLGVACPTMYFRPTFAIERALEALPEATGARPAFLLATAGGEPGAHFEILARLLERKGYGVLGACWLIFPDSWPPHHNLARLLAPLAPLASRLARLGPRGLRSLWGIGWPALGDPDAGDRARLDRFLARLLARVEAGGSPAVAPEELHHAALHLDALGKGIRREQVEPYSRPRFEAARCDGCGICVEVCPARIIIQREAKGVPVVGDGCTGCFACYNRCPTGAISAWAAPGGQAQYRGPSRAARALFRVVRGAEIEEE